MDPFRVGTSLQISSFEWGEGEYAFFKLSGCQHLFKVTISQDQHLFLRHEVTRPGGPDGNAGRRDMEAPRGARGLGVERSGEFFPHQQCWHKVTAYGTYTETHSPDLLGMGVCEETPFEGKMSQQEAAPFSWGARAPRPTFDVSLMAM